MQLENITGAGELVKPVDVLGDDRTNQPQSLKIGARGMSVIGCVSAKPSPPHEAAPPITLPICRRGNELAISHGHHPPLAVRSPVIRDTRLRGQPGARKDGDVAAAKELDELLVRPLFPGGCQRSEHVTKYATSQRLPSKDPQINR